MYAPGGAELYAPGGAELFTPTYTDYLIYQTYYF